VTWQRRAACRASPQLFDLDTDEPETAIDRIRRHAAARTICGTCPVVAECFDDAHDDPSAEGIRAGLLLENGMQL
jgi:hypothetical protein